MPNRALKLTPEQQEVLVVAPTGQDAPLIVRALGQDGMTAHVFRGIPELCDRLREDAGAILVAEEALTPDAMRHLNQRLGAQEAWSDIPIVVMTGGGETTLGSLRVLRAFNPAGNVILVERPFRPITIVSILQVALRARRKQYQVRELLQLQIQATRIRDEFISVASHELKTPLTSLKLQAQLSERLMQKGPTELSPERVKKLVQTTGNQVDRLTRLVEDMLDISRINTGKLAMSKSEGSLSAMMRDVIDRFSPQLIEKQNELETDIQDGVVGSWDFYRIEQVLYNLMSNAIRYAPGTPVFVGLRAHSDPDKVQIVVRDQGPGIAPEHQERVFERFERAVTSSNISGLGLGLYICREIVEAHGGRIWLESKLGEGASFTVELPI